MINGLDVFSGIGGISKALENWVRPVTYCENDKYAQGVLLSRMQDGSMPIAPIWDDVKSLSAKLLPAIDIIYGGFPCQDISIAGNGAGLAGKRSGLFFEIIRLTEEIRPAFVFLENVPAIRTRGLREVVRAFTDIGYDCRWTCVSAAEVGAPHLRKRWFLLAYADGVRLQSRLGSRGCKPQQSQTSNCSWWAVEPDVGRVVNGLPNRAHRLKCLGNSVVPDQVKEAFERLIGLNK